MYHFQPKTHLGSFYDVPPVTTHLAPAEVSPGFGDAKEEEEFSRAAMRAMYVPMSLTPFLMAYGAYKNGDGSGFAAVGGFVGGILLNVVVGIPALLAPPVALGAPAIAAWYAWDAHKKGLSMLPKIPQNPYQGAVWQGGPFATSPAAAHGMLHPGGSKARYPALNALAMLHKSPMALLSEYRAASDAAQSRAMMGLGSDQGETPEDKALVVFGGVLLAALALALTVRGVAGYQAGKAVAHANENKTAYALAGVLAGAVGGVPGMATVAVVAAAMRDK